VSDLRLCQGTQCHTYYTQDRLKGQKGSKTYQTRRRSGFYYGGNNFVQQDVKMIGFVSMEIKQ